MRSVFDRHDFAFKWTFAEYEGSHGLYPWTLHVIDNFESNARLLDGDRPRVWVQSAGSATSPGSASERRITRRSRGRVGLTLVHGPPYYDNVMYAELADSSTWEKQTFKAAGYNFFVDELADKDNEAV